jgi:hypothetical protein
LETDFSIGKKHRDKIGYHAVAIGLGVIEEPEDPGLHIRRHHRAVTIALGTMVALKDLDLRMTTNHRSADTSKMYLLSRTLLLLFLL